MCKTVFLTCATIDYECGRRSRILARSPVRWQWQWPRATAAVDPPAPSAPRRGSGLCPAPAPAPRLTHCLTGPLLPPRTPTFYIFLQSNPRLQVFAEDGALVIFWAGWWSREVVCPAESERYIQYLSIELLASANAAVFLCSHDQITYNASMSRPSQQNETLNATRLWFTGWNLVICTLWKSHHYVYRSLQHAETELL